MNTNCSTCNGNVSVQSNRVTRVHYNTLSQPTAAVANRTVQHVNNYQTRINQIVQQHTKQAQVIANQNSVTRYRR